MKPQALRTGPAYRYLVAAGAVVLALLASAAVQAQPPVGILPPTQEHRWMDELFRQRPAAIDQSLAQLIIPGTHDSGTYALLPLTSCVGCRNSDLLTNFEASCVEKLGPVFADLCDGLSRAGGEFGFTPWARAQERSVLAQLNAGARYLDLRFYRATAADVARTDGRLVLGNYYIHHTLTGSDATEIFDHIAAFLDNPQHAREVVIIEFSQMQEGDGAMSPQGVTDFFAMLRSRLGSRMAPETISHTTSVRDFLAAGYQTVVTCACDTTGDPDVGSSLTSYGFDGLGAAAGYPPADDAEAPWRTDDEIQALVETVSQRRPSPDEMFGMYLAIGADDDYRNIMRGFACPNDPLNATGLCDAVNDDWDRIDSLLAMSEWLNPKAIPALLSVPRSRVNIVVVDGYDTEVTQEIFKLNAGATRVALRIDKVDESDNPPLDRIDYGPDADPDYYPMFVFPAAVPAAWSELQPQRYNQVRNDAYVLPFWPAWKSYPNAQPAAVVGFAILDADSAIEGDDDLAVIWTPSPPAPPRWNPRLFSEEVSIAGCVANAAACLPYNPQRSISGGGAASGATVNFRLSSCVWSWLPGDVVDPSSLCEAAATPELSLYGTSAPEGNSGGRLFDYEVVLSTPAPMEVSVLVSTSDGTASAGTDYTAVVGKVIVFPPGQTRMRGAVNVNGDRDAEPNETVTLTMSSPSGATIAEATAEMTILNDDVVAAPELEAPGPQSGTEGSLLTLALGRLRTADSTGPWNIDVDWGDGSRGSFSVTSSGQLSGSHAYADNGVYTVRASAVAGGVWSDVASFTATIANVAPTALLQNDGPVNEGAAVTITFTNQSDPSTSDAAAGYRYAASCTNGSLAAATYATSSPTPTAICTFAEAGTHTVRGVILDKDNGATEYTTVVTVRDVLPTVTGLTAQSGHEGAPLVFSLGTLVDAASDGPWSVTVSWGDTAADTFMAAAPGLLARSHTYADNGAYTVTVAVRDAAGVNAAPASTTATIANVAPVVTAVGPTIDEGGVVTVSGTIVDPGVRDSFVVTVAWGDGTSTPHSLPAGATSYSVSHQYLDDAPTGTPRDVVPVMVAVVDKDGGSGAAATTVTVRNVAPQVQSLSFADELGTPLGTSFLALSGLPVDLSAAFSDLGTLDTHQATIAWGDGTSDAGTVSAGVVRARHTWGALGTFNVALTLTDDDTGVGTRQATVMVTNAKGAVCGLGQLLTASAGEARITTIATSSKRRDPKPDDKVVEAIDLACQMFTKRLDVLGVAMVERAVSLIERAIADGGLDPARLELLRQVEARLVLTAKWAYVSAASETTHPLRRAWAAAVAAQADAAMVDEDWLRAVRHWLAALVILVL